MDAREFLGTVYKNDKKVKNKIFERNYWRDMAVSVSTYSDGDRVQTSSNPQRKTDAMNTCIDMQSEIDVAIVQLAEDFRSVTAVIEQLPADEYDVLHMRYIQHLTNTEVADVLGKGTSYASDLHTNGVKNVQRILDGGKR